MFSASNDALAGATVQLRDIVRGAVMQTRTTTAQGEFLFAGVPPGQYVVEHITGHPPTVLALGHPFALAAGETVATFIRVGLTQPVLMTESPFSWIAAVRGHLSRAMTDLNPRLAGGALEVGVPIGLGQWIVVDASYAENAHGPGTAHHHAATIRRAAFSVAARLGNDRHSRFYGQLGAGLWFQGLAFDGAPRDAGPFRSDRTVFTIGPAFGFDIPVQRGFSLGAMVNFRITPQTPAAHWLNVEWSATARYRFSR